MAGVVHVLIVSIGNPRPYLNTRHSAGHVALEILRRQLMLPPFATSRRWGGKSALTSAGAGAGASGSRYTLLQSPTLMNVSGPWVARVWRDALKEQPGAAAVATTQLGLVVIHDDMEEDVGTVRTRLWSRSHRGHNGIKSINSVLRPSEFPGARWARVSIGIGRPPGRDPETVSRYVLEPMSADEQAAFESRVAKDLLPMLQKIEAQWASSKETQEEEGSTPKKQPRIRSSARQP